MYSEASNFVEGVDKAFIIIIGISTFFLLAITALMIYIIIKYNRKKKKAAMQFSDNYKLEIIWTIIPVILVLLMFYYGYLGFSPMRKPPKDAMEITTIGRMWEWEFIYDNKKSSINTLVLPINKPVKLNLISTDVNHSLFIPAFRVKEDVVPGYKNYMWFIPQKKGEYDILCAEYCGLKHSDMLGIARVVSEQEYKNWLDSLPEIPKGKNSGLKIIRKNGCTACHSSDGSKLLGSSFKGIFDNDKIVITNGKERKVKVTKEYIKTSIYEPNKDIVKGYSPNLMLSYKKKVSELEVDTIYMYLKELNKIEE